MKKLILIMIMVLGSINSQAQMVALIQNTYVEPIECQGGFVGTTDETTQTATTGTADVRAWQVEMTEDGWVTEISMFHNAASNSNKLGLAVYTDIGDLPGNILTEGSIPAIEAGWNTISVDPVYIEGGAKIWLGWGANTINVSYLPLTGELRARTGSTYTGDMANPFGTPLDTGAFSYAINLTYVCDQPFTLELFPQDNGASKIREFNALGSVEGTDPVRGVTTVSTDAIQGEYSIKTENLTTFGSSKVVIHGLTAGNDYRYTFYAKAENPNSQRVSVWDYPDYNTPISASTQDLDWTAKAINFTSITNSVEIWHYGGDGNGDPGDVLYIDRASLIDVSPPTDEMFFNTTSTLAAWTPTDVENSGATLEWTAAGDGITTQTYSGTIPTFNLSANTGTVKISATSSDNLDGVTNIRMPDKDITDLDVSFAQNVDVLFFYTNPLTTIDVTQNTVLTRLWLSSTNLDNVNLYNNPLVDDFKCSSCNLPDAQMDFLFDAINDGGTINGTIEVAGNPGSPTLAVNGTFNGLRTKGWAIDIPSPNAPDSGTNLLADGDFSNPSSWIIAGTNSDITNGLGHINSISGESSFIYQLVVEDDKIYDYEFDAYVPSGTLVVTAGQSGTGASQVSITSNGFWQTYAGQMTTDGSSNANFMFRRSGSMEAYFTNAYFKEALPPINSGNIIVNGTFDSGASWSGNGLIANGFLTIDSDGSYVSQQQQVGLVDYEAYNYRIDTWVDSGTSQLNMGDTYGTRSAANFGVNTGWETSEGVLMQLADGSGEVYLKRNSATFSRIDNFSMWLSRPDFVENGGFDSDTWWTKQNGTTIGSGVATINTTATFAYALLTPTLELVDGHKYNVTFDVPDYTQGTIRAAIGGTGQDTGYDVEIAGTYTVTLEKEAAALNRLVFATKSGTTQLDIDNVSIRPADIYYQDNFGSTYELESVGDWYGLGGNASTVVIDTDSQEGDYSMEIENIYADGNAVRAELDLELIQGESYDITIWAKSISGAESAFTGWLGFSNPEYFRISNTTWTEYKWSGIIPNAATQKIRAYPSSNSGVALLGDKILIDGIRIEHNIGTYDLEDDELANGDFSNGSTSWILGFDPGQSAPALVGETMQLSHVGGNAGACYLLQNTMEVGKRYRIGYEVTANTDVSGNGGLHLDNPTTPIESTVGFHYIDDFVATNTYFALVIENGLPDSYTITVDNLSAREITE